MTGDDSEALRTRLDEFSRRLDARIKEFRQRGELSLDHATTSARLREHRDSIEKKLHAAIEKRREADILKYEFERDLTSFAENFEDFIRQIDAAADAPASGAAQP